MFTHEILVQQLWVGDKYYDENNNIQCVTPEHDGEYLCIRDFTAEIGIMMKRMFKEVEIV